MKTTFIILLSLILFGCNVVKKDTCADYTELSGQYKHAVNEGVVTWAGEFKGTVDFAGVDFNEMTCTYELIDCETGALKMNCNGADFETTVEIREDNSILLNSSLYKKI